MREAKHKQTNKICPSYDTSILPRKQKKKNCSLIKTLGQDFDQFTPFLLRTRSVRPPPPPPLRLDAALTLTLWRASASSLPPLPPIARGTTRVGSGRYTLNSGKHFQNPLVLSISELLVVVAEAIVVIVVTVAVVETSIANDDDDDSGGDGDDDEDEDDGGGDSDGKGDTIIAIPLAFRLSRMVVATVASSAGGRGGRTTDEIPGAAKADTLFSGATTYSDADGFSLEEDVALVDAAAAGDGDDDDDAGRVATACEKREGRA